MRRIGEDRKIFAAVRKRRRQEIVIAVQVDQMVEAMLDGKAAAKLKVDKVAAPGRTDHE